MARPLDVDDLAWLRRHGIQVLISLTEDPLPRQWVNDAGLMAIHVPVPDMEPPTDRQLDHLVETIRRANSSSMGVAIHCGAGFGRTGTVLAAYLVEGGMTPADAIAKVRELRPGSIETTEQERAIERYASRSRQPPTG